MDEEYRGYPTEIFVSFPSSHLLCSICLEVLRNPMQCVTEGHLFCRGNFSTHPLM